MVNLVALVLWPAGLALAQPVSGPDLEPVFADNFSSDTRDEYKVVGDVAWKPGELILNAGASLERAVTASAHTQVDVTAGWRSPAAGVARSEHRLWFLLEGATDCCVRFVIDANGHGSLALIDTSEKDGKLVDQVVRSSDWSPTSEPLRLEYHHGRVVVRRGTDILLHAYIRNGLAAVAAIRLTTNTALSMRAIGAATRRSGFRTLTAQDQQRADEARALGRDFVRHYRAGEYKKAEEVGRKVVEMRRSVLGNQHPDYATSVNNLGFLYDRLGEYAQAVSLYREALEIDRRQLGEWHPKFATSLSNLALVYDTMGDYRQAEQLGRQALTIRRSVLGEAHPDYGVSVNNLALVQMHLGRYQQAETLYLEALDIDRAAVGEQHPSYASSLSNLALLYQWMGEFERAEPICEQALAIRKSTLGEQHPEYATSLSNMAGLYVAMGDYARAIPMRREVVDIDKAARGEQHPEYAVSLATLAGLYYRMGDYAQAEPLYQESQRITEAALGTEHPQYAAGLHNLAVLYDGMGDDARARSLYEHSLEISEKILGREHPDYVSSLSNLATLYSRLGDTARAEALHKQALELRRTVLGDDHPAYATSLHNLAAVYFKQGDYTQAAALQNQALGIRRQQLGESHPRYAVTLHTLGVLHDATGDRQRARELLEEALAIRRAVLGEQHPACAGTLDRLASLAARSGDLERAESLATEALSIVRASLDASSIVQSERQQKRNQTMERLHLDTYLSVALARNSPAQLVLESLWRWKGAVTLRQRAYRIVAANPELAPTFAALQSVSRRLSALSSRLPVPPAADSTDSVQQAWREKKERWDEKFLALSRQRESLEQQIAANSGEFQTLRDPLTVDAVRKVLPQRTAFIDLLEYNHKAPDTKGPETGEPRYIAFVIRSDRKPQMLGLGTVKSLSEAIAAVRRPLTLEDTVEDAAAAKRLRESLWVPLEAHLDGIDTVIVSPDTVLGTLPLGILPGRAPGSYLIEQYRFACVPLAGMIQAFHDEDAARRTPEKGLLVLGDVNYDTGTANSEAGKAASRPAWLRRSAPRSGDSGWKSLPGFQQELAIVRDQFEKAFGGGVTTLRGNRATEAEFIREAPRHYNLHLITHGFFASPEFSAYAGAADATGSPLPSRLGDNQSIQQFLPGLLSGVVLAGANNPPLDPTSESDGILTAAEIETLNLNAVDLVVLSACETGLGKTAGGEGLTGLQRAFHIAGARSCIATLWQVPDKATQELMSRFYRNYWEQGQSRIDALRNAQLSILNDIELTRGDPRQRQEPTRETRKDRAHPKFWAAFVLSGDWR